MRKILLFSLVALMLLSTSAHAVARDYPDIQITTLRYDPSPAEPGKYVDLWVKVENAGDRSASDVVITLVPKFPFSLDPTEDAEIVIGTIAGSEFSTQKYHIRVDSDAIQGSNEIDILYSYSGQSGKETLALDVQSSYAELGVDRITTTPETIVPGSMADVTLTMKNLADVELKDITVKLDMTGSDVPFTPITSSTEKKIKSLSAGAEEDLTFRVIADADAEPMAYKIPLEITFSDNLGNTYTNFERSTSTTGIVTTVSQDVIGLVIDADPELSLNIEDVPAFTGGMKGDVIFSVSNVGVANVKFLTLELLESDYYTILSAPKNYMGNLDSDDFETAEFTVYMRPGAPEDTPLLVRLEYKDSYNDLVTETIEKKVRVYTQKELADMSLVSNGSSTTYVLLLLVVVGGVFWYRKKKKRKKGLAE